MLKFKILIIWLEESTVFDEYIGCILHVEGVIHAPSNVVFDLLVFGIGWGVVLGHLFVGASFHVWWLFWAALWCSILVVDTFSIWEVTLLHHSFWVWVIVQDIVPAFFLELLNEVVGHRFLCGLAVSLDDFHHLLREVPQLVRGALVWPLCAFGVGRLRVSFR